MNDIPSILLIDDEAEFRTAFAESLKDNIKQELLQIKLASSGKQGLKIIQDNNRKGRKTFVFIDIILPDILGDELVKKIDRETENITGILLSAHKSDRELKQIQNKYKWLIDSFTKPLDKNKLTSTITSFLGDSPISKFDYGTLDRETADFIIKETQTIKTLMRQTVEGIIETGERLHKVKQKLKHGEFMIWLSSEIRCHYSTALHFMRVWQTFGDRKEQIAHAGINASVLYLLSAPSTPEQLRVDILEMAEAGNSISFNEAKRLKKEYSQRQQVSDATRPISSKNSVDSVTTIDVVAQISSSKAQPNTTAIAKVARKSEFWHLGNHLLYCGAPHDREFCDRLSNNIALNIGFPDSPSWDKNTLFPKSAKSTLVFHSIFQDLDLVTLRNIIQKSIELCTESGEVIFFSSFPYPEMLVLADNLKCQCFIAESNFARCQDIINFWNSVNQGS